MRRRNDFVKQIVMKGIKVLVFILAFAGAVNGQQPVDIIMKARALNSNGKPDQAVKVLTDALATSNDSRFYLERAETKLSQHAYSDAISDLNEANRITPSSGEFGLSQIYALKGDAATSLYHLELSMHSSSKRTEKEIMLDPALSLLQNRPEWRQFWKKEWYSETEKSVSEIEYYVSTGKIEESKTILSEIRRNYQNSDEIIYAEALINLSSGKYDDAVKSLSGLLTAAPSNEKYMRLMAKAQTLAGNPAGASTTYTRLFESGVADAEILLLRAECYRKTGETDKALKDIDKYIDMYPQNEAALSLAGKVEAASGDNLKAIDYYSKNLKLHPNDPQCYIDRANSYFVSKSWDWAINDYSMSLDLNPANSEVWLNKGIALLSSGRVEEACHDFRKALSLGNKKASEYVSNNCIK
jgi:tetratricopeptide (TPR) repeat protein